MHISDFIALIENFLSRNISVSEFESQYIDYHQNHNEVLGAASDSLFWLFTEVDAYTDDLTAFDEDPDNYINEEQLRVSAQKTLDELSKLLK